MTVTNGDLPEGWVEATLGDVARWSSGGTPKAGTAAYYGGDIPWAVIGDLNDGVVASTASTITEAGLANSSAKVVGAGTILLGMYGSIGKLGIAAVPMATNQAIACAVPNPEIDTAYLFHFLKSQRDDLLRAGKGGAQQNISQTVLKAWPIQVPPIGQQRLIARWLEEIGGHRASIAARLAAARAIVDRVGAAVLGAACAGSLTSDWREQTVPMEGAAELASRVASRRHGGPGRNRRESIGKPGDWAIPEAWVWTTPEQLRIPERSLTYGVIKLGPSVDGGVPTLRSSDVRWLRIDNDRVKHISRTIADQYRRTYLAGGEVLVTVRGTLGGVAVVPADMAGWNISREVAVVPLVGEVDPEFVACMIGSPQCRRWLSHVAKGVAYTGVNIADLKQLPLPLPAIEEQREIVRRVSHVLANVNRLDAAVSAAQGALDGAGRGALAKALRGEITVSGAGQTS